MENELSYKLKQDMGNLKSHSHILQLYKKNLKKAITLNSTFPVFLDTNVLLRTYSISFNARTKILDFYNKRKKDIYITDYTQNEFIRNREDVINRFFDNVTNKIPNDFKSEVITQIGSFLERNKIVFKDYDSFELKLRKIKEQCEALHSDLLSEVEKQEEVNSNLILEDKQLSILSETNCLEPLSEIEIKSIKTEFDLLSKNIDPEKVNNLINKPGKVFPGIGDIKEKPENPHGDYIIFHEMMKFSKESGKDIIFLTYDTTKGDWMRKDKKPHLHYIENFYLNTGQIIFILDAERVFEDLLDISFKSLIQNKSNVNYNTPLNTESLSNYLSTTFSHIENTDNQDLINQIYLELVENGYTSIEGLMFDINRAEDAFNEYLKVKEKSKNKYTRVGNLRVRLYISNPDYKCFKKDSNSYELVNKESYEPFLHLLTY